MSDNKKVDLKIDWATHKAAEYACKHWHYSGCMPKSKTVKIGVWENDIYIGVVIFSVSVSPFLLKKYGLNQSDGCELTRVALKTHITSVSKIIKIALNFLKKSNPKLKMVVSFADPKQGHYGGIYQAGNWIYTGKSNTVQTYVFNNSKKRWHTRTIFRKFKTSDINRLRGAKVITDPGKHRYLMPLTKEMRKKILPLSKPYPKACQVGDDPDQGDSGGSTPTGTLQ